MMYLLLAVLCLAWLVRGIEQAVLWSRQGADSFKWNEHILFIISRGLFISGLVIATSLSWFVVVGIASVSILLFPFLHDGMYYVSRNWIADGENFLGEVLPYDKGWWSEPSETSTANIDFSWKVRWILAINGLVLLIVLQIIL